MQRRVGPKLTTRTRLGADLVLIAAMSLELEVQSATIPRNRLTSALACFVCLWVVALLKD